MGRVVQFRYVGNLETDNQSQGLCNFNADRRGEKMRDVERSKRIRSNTAIVQMTP